MRQIMARDQEIIDERCSDLWNAVFHTLDSALGGEKSGQIAQIASDAYRLKLERFYAVDVQDNPSQDYHTHEMMGGVCQTCGYYD